MSQTGFELHTGDWASVCDACTTGEPSKLHSGDHSESHVIFPDPFGAGDILFIQDIVAEITSSSPIHIDFERWECGCLFVDRLAINWVRSVATLDVNNGTRLLKRWSEMYFASENRLPDWHAHENGNLGKELWNHPILNSTKINSLSWYLARPEIYES